MKTMMRMISGILARLFLMGYTIFIIVKVATLKKTSVYYSFCTLLLLNLAEFILFTGVLRVCSRNIKSAEKRITICILNFLLCTWPIMWMMEQHYVQGMKNYTKPDEDGTAKYWQHCNTLEYQQIYRFEKRSQVLAKKRSLYLWEAKYLCCAMIARFMTTLQFITLDNVYDWLVILIFNATDVLELVQNIHEKTVATQPSLIRSILFLVHFSQLQFCLKKTSLFRSETSNGRRRDGDLPWKVLDLILPIVLQDLPFLCLRLKLFSHFKVSNFHLRFYIIKNLVLVVLQCLRVLIAIISNMLGTYANHD